MPPARDQRAAFAASGFSTKRATTWAPGASSISASPDLDIAVAGLRARSGVMPNVTILPGRRRRDGRQRAAFQRVIRVIAASAAIIQMTRRGSSSRHQQRGGGDRGGAVAADGLEHDAGALDARRAHLLGDQEAVFLVADDDRRREFGAGRPRSAVSSIIEWSEISGQNCLGKLSRDTGQSRVPEPPERITGTIRSPLVPRPDCEDPVLATGRIGGIVVMASPKRTTAGSE